MAEDVRKWKQSSTPHHGGRQLSRHGSGPAGLMGLILCHLSLEFLCFLVFFFVNVSEVFSLITKQSSINVYHQNLCEKLQTQTQRTQPLPLAAWDQRLPSSFF